MQQLIDKVIQIRPDLPASALDMELLSAQVLKDQRTFKKKLKKIENGVKKALGPAANVGDDEMPDMPALPQGDPMEHLMEQTKVLTLEEFPLDVLLQCLKARVDPRGSIINNVVPQHSHTRPSNVSHQMQMQMPHAVP